MAPAKLWLPPHEDAEQHGQDIRDRRDYEDETEEVERILTRRQNGGLKRKPGSRHSSTRNQRRGAAASKRSKTNWRISFASMTPHWPRFCAGKTGSEIVATIVTGVASVASHSLKPFTLRHNGANGNGGVRILGGH